MENNEKVSFEKRHNSGRIAKNLWQYIPDRLKENGSIDGIEIDSFGYWIILNENFAAYDWGSGSSVIHEYRISDLKKALQTIRPIHADYLQKKDWGII